MPSTRSVRSLLAAPLRGFSPEVRGVLRTDIAATLLLTGFAGLTSPFTGLILRRDLGATPLQLSIMASAGAAFLLLSLLWARPVHQRMPLPYVVWPGFLARGLYLLVPFITSAWPFVGLVVAGNFLGTVAGPAQSALIQRLYPRAERGRALGTVRMIAGGLAVGLPIVAGRLLGARGYRWVFPLASLLGMGASLCQRRLRVPDAPPLTGRERARPLDPARVLREDPRFRRLLVAQFVFGCGIWIQMPANPIVVVDVLHVSASQVGLFAAVGAVGSLVASGFWGRFVDRYSSLPALRNVYLVGALTAVLYYVAPGPWALLGISVSDSFMTAGLDMVWTLAVIDAAGPNRTARYAAISSVLAGVRGVIAPLLGAMLIQRFGVHSVYPVAATVMIGAAFFVTSEGRRVPQAVSA